MSTSENLEALERDGFVLIPSLLTQDQIAELRKAAKETVELARSGAWPHVRTLPKQFPPLSPQANPLTSGTPPTPPPMASGVCNT
ncbi:hypothetical protein ACMFMF_005684 [Clarireedia jacksonii]